MTAESLYGLAGTLIGGTGCFLLGYGSALYWVRGILNRKGIDLDADKKQEVVS